MSYCGKLGTKSFKSVESHHARAPYNGGTPSEGLFPVPNAAVRDTTQEAPFGTLTSLLPAQLIAECVNHRSFLRRQSRNNPH